MHLCSFRIRMTTYMFKFIYGWIWNPTIFFMITIVFTSLTHEISRTHLQLTMSSYLYYQNVIDVLSFQNFCTFKKIYKTLDSNILYDSCMICIEILYLLSQFQTPEQTYNHGIYVSCNFCTNSLITESFKVLINRLKFVEKDNHKD